jgi:histone H2A
MSKISKNTLHKLCLIAGAKQVSGVMYEILRGKINEIIEDLFKIVYIYVKHSYRKTITENDVRLALHDMPNLRNFHIGPNIQNIKKCKSAPTYKKKYNSTVNFKKKALAVQKQHNCLHIPKAIFERLCRKEIKKILSGDMYVSKIRISKNALNLAQISIEDYIIKLLRGSVKSAINSGRSVLHVKDLQHIANIIEEANSGNGITLLTDINFSLYIKKILKGINPLCRSSQDFIVQINNFLNLLANKIASKSYLLSHINKRKTISARCIQSAIELILPGELRKFAKDGGIKSVKKYLIKIKKEKGERGRGGRKNKHKVTKSNKAGLQFPVTKMKQYFKVFNTNIGNTADVYLASVLEYITAELVDISCNAATDTNHITIKSRDLMLFVSHDEETRNLANNIGFSTALGGSPPNTHAVNYYTQKKKSKKKSKKKN